MANRKPSSMDKSKSSLIDAAMFVLFSDAEFMRNSLKAGVSSKHAVLVSDTPALIENLPYPNIPPSVLGLGEHSVAGGSIHQAVSALLQFQAHSQETSQDASDVSPDILIVDMTWSARTVIGTMSLENWGHIAEQISNEFGIGMISIYNRELLIENQMQSALRAHRQFLAPSGIYKNPFWLPATLSANGTIDEQMAFLLEGAVPDYGGIEFFDPLDRSYARGADPGWVSKPSQIQITTPKSTGWQVHCLGPLQVYLADQTLVSWNFPGSSPHKTRTLFAYLLSAGEKGAHTERMCELLWPNEAAESTKRGRFHHAVAMLRRALGSKNSVLRSGEFYRLNAPPGSWIDISSFEQICRRGLALAKQDQVDEALLIYRSGQELYRGDLFEDIPLQYVHSENEDWCLPRRRWLRDMALKIYRDASVLLRSQNRQDEALPLCQKALALDPMNEDINCETMRVFHAQGRTDTIIRQYKQYLTTLENMGGTHESAAIHKVYRNLMQ